MAFGLFKEVHCAHCGGKAGIATRRKLADGNYICGKCLKNFPVETLEEVEKIGYDDFPAVKQYYDVENPRLKKLFKKTKAFHGVQVDTEKLLVCIDYLSIPVYVNILDLDYDFTFVADTVKEGFFSTKVTGSIVAEFQDEDICLSSEKVIATDVKTSARLEGVLKQKVVYDHPKEMAAFEAIMLDMLNRATDTSDDGDDEM